MSVAVRRLSKAYGGQPAVREVSFEVAAGEIVGLLGPNGAGKTTTVECLLGLRAPDSGEIEVCGIDPQRRGRQARALTGAVLQDIGLPDQITPGEAITAVAALKGVDPDPSLLARFGLAQEAAKRFARLSGGQKQRLALALAFVATPRVVVLDEPSAGLDIGARRDLHGMIRQIAADGCAVLLTTHDMAEAQGLCDRVVVLDRGRVAAEGRPDMLGTGAAAKRADVRTAGTPPTPPADLPGVRAISADDAGVRLEADDLGRALAGVLGWLGEAGVVVLSVQAGEPGLEEAIYGLTAGRQD